MTYTDVAKQIAPYVRKCPVPIQKQVFWNTVRAFCVGTECYREDVEITVEDGSFELPDHTRIIRIVSISDGDTCIPEYTYEFTPPDTIEFADDGFTDSETVTGTFVLCPSMDAVAVPESVSVMWTDALISGTIGRLCAMSGNPWFNQTSAAMYSSAYSQAVNRCKRMMTQGFKSGQMSVRHRSW